MTTLARLLLPVLVLASAACTAGPGAQPSPETVIGRTFVSSSVIGRTLVPGTQVRITFTNAQVGASAGCNTMSGRYTVTAGQLIVEELATTEMGCDAPRHEQDEWLAAFLAAKPTLRIAGNDLTLEADGITLRLLDREIAEPDQPLVGTTWTLESIAWGDTVSSVPVGVATPTVSFGADGRLTFTTGCNDGFVSYAVDGSKLTLGALGTTKKACAGEGGEVERQVLAILGAGGLTVAIDSSVLKLSGAGGRLEYRAAALTQ